MGTKGKRILAAVAALALGLVTTGCGSRQQHSNHAHHYRHGYYNPVDGYFHDDHWHRSPHHTSHHGPGHAASYNYY